MRVTDTTYTNNLNITSLTASYAVLTDANKNLVSRGITDNTTATAVTASTNLITANTLYYHKGNSNIVTVGTISSGTWQGTAIAAAYIGNHSTDKLTSGTLGTARGGTGNNSYTGGRLLYTNTATKFATSDAAQFDGTNLTLTGTLTLSKTTDLAYNADNKPALIIGGASTAEHIEIDANEIQAKTNGTSAAILYINNGGGNLIFNPENGNYYTQVRSTAAATSATTGALRISGGLSTGAASYLTGSVHIVGAAGDSPLLVRGIAGCGTDGNRDTSTTSGQSLYLNVNGGPVYVGKTDNTATNQLIVAYTTPAGSTTTGALTVAGGAGITGNLYTGGYIDISIPSNITATNNNVPSDIYNGLYLCDSDDKGIVYLRGGAHTDGHTSAFLGVKNHDTTGADLGYTGILMTKDKDGTSSINLQGTMTDIEHKLNIGVREITSAPSSTTVYDRITITPFYHTGGPWQIRLRENGTEAYLSLYYGGTHLTSIRHDGARPYAYEGFCRGVYNGSVDGSTHAAALQACFNSYKSIIPRNQLLAYYSSAHSNGSLCFGYWLSNYDTNPYGGFYVCNYTIPYYVGIANGSYYESRLWKSGDAVTGAVWNDYAEFRTSECKEFGYVVMETGKDTLTKTTERLSHFAGVTSDTWGFSQGETETAKTPLAVAGRVLVYTYKDRNEYKPGDCVCAAPNGTVDIMTRDEIVQFPDRIVGIVSCVPDYEEWGGGKGADRDPIKVNGRIWIKVH